MSVSIPFEQGDVFRQITLGEDLVALCLNPFRAGRCLSTIRIPKLNRFDWSQSLSSRAMSFDKVLRNNSINPSYVSIPFEQGDVFRLNSIITTLNAQVSQSLSSRAMSFDCSGMLEAGSMRPFRPTSQFFWKVKELALDLSK